MHSLAKGIDVSYLFFRKTRYLQQPIDKYGQIMSDGASPPRSAGRSQASGLRCVLKDMLRAAAAAESADPAAREFAKRLLTSGRERNECDACTICYLYIGFPIDKHAKMNYCCMKMICNGCLLAAELRGSNDTCPFCRTPQSADDASSLAMIQNRADKGDATAISLLAYKYAMAILDWQRIFLERSNCGQRLQSLDQEMQITNSASRTIMAMVSKKTEKKEFSTGSRPR